MAIQKSTIEALKARMKDAPEVAKEKRNVSKQEAIRELRKEIEAMQKRGYTLDEIAKFLSDGGLQITTPTLKSYMQRAKPIKATTANAENFTDAKKTEEQKQAQTKAKQETPSKPKSDGEKGSFDVRPDSDI